MYVCFFLPLHQFAETAVCQGDRGPSGERGQKGFRGDLGDTGSPGQPVKKTKKPRPHLNDQRKRVSSTNCSFFHQGRAGAKGEAGITVSALSYITETSVKAVGVPSFLDVFPGFFLSRCS